MGGGKRGGKRGSGGPLRWGRSLQAFQTKGRLITLCQRGGKGNIHSLCLETPLRKNFRYPFFGQRDLLPLPKKNHHAFGEKGRGFFRRGKGGVKKDEERESPICVDEGAASSRLR